MTSKYAGVLPDIDTSQPDVFETPDVPESYAYEHSSDSDSDNDADLMPTASGSNLLSLAGARKDQSKVATEDAIDKARLSASDARDRFSQNKNGLADVINANIASVLTRSKRPKPTSSLLPESVSYTIAGTSSSRTLSATARRQLKTNASIAGRVIGIEESETPTDRLRRLRFELQELEEQMVKDAAAEPDEEEAIVKDTEDPSELPLRDDANKTRPAGRRKKKPLVDSDGQLRPSVVLSQLNKLKVSLDKLEPRNLQQRSQVNSTFCSNRTNELLSQLEGRSLNVTTDVEDVHATSRQTGSALRTDVSSVLDERLHILEKYIGAEQSEGSEKRHLSGPLVQTMAKLEYQLQLLTQPRHLESIARRVKMLMIDLDRVHEARRKIGDTRPLNVALASGISVSTGAAPMPPLAGATAEQQLSPDALQKIDALFQLLPRIEPLIPLTPSILTRLRSLSALHTSSAAFAESLQDAENTIDSLKQSEVFMRDLLSGLQDSLQCNRDVVKQNAEILSKRIDVLAERIGKL